MDIISGSFILLSSNMWVSGSFLYTNITNAIELPVLTPKKHYRITFIFVKRITLLFISFMKQGCIYILNSKHKEIGACWDNQTISLWHAEIISSSMRETKREDQFKKNEERWLRLTYHLHVEWLILLGFVFKPNVNYINKINYTDKNIRYSIWSWIDKNSAEAIPGQIQPLLLLFSLP